MPQRGCRTEKAGRERRSEMIREEEMGTELTLGDVYDDLSERIALARTKALMGERVDALGILQGANLEYT